MPSWARLRKAIANAVPVLCYHNLGGNGVSRDDFEAQMQWLDNNGYKTLTSSELKAVLEGRKLDCPSVVITFDDAYRDLLTYAKDVLERHKFRALVFVINNRIRPESRIGEQGEINSDNAHRGYFQMGDTSPWLSTVELKTLHDSGIFEIGSHSYTHAMEPSGRIVEGEPPRHWAYEAWRDKESDHAIPVLAPEFTCPIWKEESEALETDQDFFERVLENLLESKLDLEEKFGHEIRSFAWPWGQAHPVAMKAVENAGFELVFSLRRGSVSKGTPLLDIPRLEVRKDKPLCWFTNRITLYSNRYLAGLYSKMRL